MPEQGRVIIVGEDGKRHIFPPGFDPKRAAEIVRGGPPKPEAPQPTVFGMEMKPEAAALFEGVEAQGGPLLPPFGANAIIKGGRAVMSAGGMGKAYAAAAGAASQAAPAIKYEVAKSTLEEFGVPTPIASSIAMALSSYKRGGRAPAATPSAPPAARPAAHVPANATGTQWGPVSPASVAAPRVSPAASTPAAPASGAAPTAGTSARAVPATPELSPTVAPTSVFSRWSPQRIRNEVGLAEKRAGLKLTEAERAQADRLVATGTAPKEAVTTVAGPGSAASAPTSTAAAAAPKARLSAAESKELQRMLQMGKTEKEAYASIELQRGLAARLGTQTPEQVRQKVAVRNATTRWPKE